MKHLEEILNHYGVKGQTAQTTEGPLVKLVEFRPAPGTKLKNVTAYIEDIARELGVRSLRVGSIEENGTIGFEFPAKSPQTVDFERLLKSSEFMADTGALPLILGVGITGAPVITDLAKMPHLLVAGTTGSGKSIGLNTFILSLIAKKNPEDLKFVLIDPKRIEFSIYNKQKYMLAPVVTDINEASATLAFLVEEMERRYILFEKNLSKNISDYNEHGGHLPYIVCVIDEFADLMASDKQAGNHIQRLAQKARAAGIHIILATQRPSVDVVTGVLKANFPTRLAYKTASSADSRTILDTAGAEKLLGRGDALFLQSDGNLKRIHGAYMSDDKIAALLAPFRGETKSLPVPQTQPPTEKKEKTHRNWFRKIWDFWTSLRQKDKKAIINAVVFAIGFISGKKPKRK